MSSDLGVTGSPGPTLIDDEHRLQTLELAIAGMHCSACSTRVQRALGRHQGVASAAVNLATTRAFVTYDPDRTDPGDLCSVVDATGYSAAPARRTRTVRPTPRTTTGDCGWHSRGHWPWWPWSWPIAAPETAAGWLDGPRAGRRRRDCRRVAVLAERRPAAAPRRHQHGHLDRPRHTGGPGGHRRRDHRPGRSPHPSGRERVRSPPDCTGSWRPSSWPSSPPVGPSKSRARARAADALHSLLALRPPWARVVRRTRGRDGRTGGPRERARRRAGAGTGGRVGAVGRHRRGRLLLGRRVDAHG